MMRSGFAGEAARLAVCFPIFSLVLSRRARRVRGAFILPRPPFLPPFAALSACSAALRAARLARKAAWFSFLAARTPRTLNPSVLKSCFFSGPERVLARAAGGALPVLGEVVEVLRAVDVAAVAAHHRRARGLLLRAHAEERLGHDGAAAGGGAGGLARGDAEGRGLAEEGAAGGEGAEEETAKDIVATVCPCGACAAK